MSRSLERAARLAETVGAEATTDLDAVLRDPEVDAVDVCLPTPAHREATEQALRAGKHVFLEKPIALTLEDADAILRAAEASGRLFMVGLVLRFWPEYVELQRRVDAGDLGRITAVATRRLSPPADWAAWLGDPTQSGGTAVDLLVHDFDQMNWLFGKPISVFAREPAPGHVQALVEYEDGSGTAEGSMRMPRSYPFSSTIRVDCEHGAAEYAFSAAPAEGGGNIGEAQGPPGLRLYPSRGWARDRAGGKRRSVGPGDLLLRRVHRAGPRSRAGDGRAGAGGATCVARREPFDRERAHRVSLTSRGPRTTPGYG